MHLKKILVAIDFSEASAVALDYASRLASQNQPKLFIVHVDPLLDVNVGMGEGVHFCEPPGEIDRSEVREELNKVRPAVAGLRFEHWYLTGSPLEQILKFADQNQVDLIVMGSHGRSGISRLLMGSVAEGVMRRAKCPVLVVRQPAAAHEGSATQA